MRLDCPMDRATVLLADDDDAFRVLGTFVFAGFQSRADLGF